MRWPTSCRRLRPNALRTRLSADRHRCRAGGHRIGGRQLLRAADEVVVVLRAEPLAYRTLAGIPRTAPRRKSRRGEVQFRGLLLTLPASEATGGTWDEQLCDSGSGRICCRRRSRTTRRSGRHFCSAGRSWTSIRPPRRPFSIGGSRRRSVLAQEPTADGGPGPDGGPLWVAIGRIDRDSAGRRAAHGRSVTADFPPSAAPRPPRPDEFATELMLEPIDVPNAGPPPVETPEPLTAGDATPAEPWRVRTPTNWRRRRNAAPADVEYVGTGHGGEVTGIAFAPSGEQMATVGWDRTIRFWDLISGEEIAALEGHAGVVSAVLFSPGRPDARQRRLGQRRQALGPGHRRRTDPRGPRRRRDVDRVFPGRPTVRERQLGQDRSRFGIRRPARNSPPASATTRW